MFRRHVFWGFYEYSHVGYTMCIEDCHSALHLIYPDVKLAIGCSLFLKIGVRSHVLKGLFKIYYY
jgi:hypothetical protein